MRRDKQKGKTVDNGQLALILYREKRIHAVRHPVGGCHQAATDKGRPTGHQPDHHQRPTDQLNSPRAVDDKRGCYRGRVYAFLDEYAPMLQKFA